MINELKALEDITKEVEDKLQGKADTARRTAGMLGKGINILEYWDPFDNSRRLEEEQRVMELDKKISRTYRKYIFIWIIFIVITIFVCKNFV